MNSFALIRHLLAKDIRHQRALLICIWAYALLVPLLLPLYEFHNGTQFQFFYLNPLYTLLMIVTIRTLQLDPPGRVIHFLATRPVPGLKVVAAKALFLGLLLFLPLLAAKLETVGMLQVSFSLLDMVCFLVETAIVAGAFFAVVAVPALFLRKLAAALLVLVFSTVGFVFAYLVFFNRVRSVFAEADYMPDPQLGACQWLMFELGLAVTFLLGATVFYGRKAWPSAAALFVAGFLASVALLFFWPVRLDEIVSGERFATVPAPLRDQLRLQPDGAATGGWTVWENHIDIQALPQTFKIAGLQFPYYAVEKDFHAEAPNFGLTSSFDYGVLHGVGGMGSPFTGSYPLVSAAQKQLAGFPPLQSPEGNRYTLDVFDYVLGPTAQPIHWEGHAIKGEMTLDIRRAFIVRKMPVTPEMTFDLSRRRYEVEFPRMHPQRGTYPAGGWPSLTMTMTRKAVPLVLRGDYAAGAQNLSWLVVREDANHQPVEYLEPGNNWSGMFPFSGAFFSVERFSSELVRPSPGADSSVSALSRPPGPPIPHDWLDSATLVIFGDESYGRANFSYLINAH